MSLPTPTSLVGGWLVGLLRELALWSGILLSVASALAFYHGWKRRQVASLIAETPRSDVADVRSPAVVRVRGTVQPEVETDVFTSPIGGDEQCVLAGWEIEERYDTNPRSWETSAWGVRSVPFYVADGTGTLLIDLEDRTVGNETDDLFTLESLLASEGVSVEGLRCEFDSFEVRVETGYEEAPPRRTAEFLESTDGVSVDPMATDLVVDASERKYREQTLQPGDEVSVVGYAEPRRDSPGSAARPENLVVTQSDEATLYLATQPLDDVHDGAGGLLLGLLVGAVGLALLAAVLVL